MKYFTLRGPKVASALGHHEGGHEHDGGRKQHHQQGKNSRFSSSQDNLQRCHLTYNANHFNNNVDATTGGSHPNQGHHKLHFCKPTKSRPKLSDVAVAMMQGQQQQHQVDIKSVTKSYQIHHQLINQMDPFLLSPCPKSAPLPRKNYSQSQQETNNNNCNKGGSKSSKKFSPLQKLLHRQRAMKSSRSIEELENDTNLNRALSGSSLSLKETTLQSTAVIVKPVKVYHASSSSNFSISSEAISGMIPMVPDNRHCFNHTMNYIRLVGCFLDILKKTQG